MLVDIPQEWIDREIERRREFNEKFAGTDTQVREDAPWHPQTGVYSGVDDFTWIDERERVSDYPFDPLFMFNERDYEDFEDCVRDRFAELRRQWDLDYPFEVPMAYGMADNYQQILARWPLIETSYRKFFLNVRTISKAEQPSTGGFRFHKNGTYIGTQPCKGYEYFADEDGMGDVILWNLHELKDPS